MRCILAVALALATVTCASAARARSGMSAHLTANPVRKVVNLLQAMQKKVQEEGEAEEKLFSKFKCYCKQGGKELGASITAAEGKVPALSSDIDASTSKLAQLKDDVKTAQADRSTAKETMAKATALREKEAKAFAAEKSESEANLAALNKAIAALEKGMAGSFLQTQAAEELKELAGRLEMIESDRQELLSFLSGTEGSGYAPQSGEIVGILKQMGETMSKGLAEAIASEEASAKTHAELMAAKTREVAALQASLEAKLEQIGEVGVDIAQMKEDLDDTEATLSEDKHFLAHLEGSCAKKDREWEERTKLRAEELVALADTIKVLNDDDALDLFKKTLPSAASFMQVQVTAASLRSRGMDELRRLQRSAGHKHRAELDLLVLALSGKKGLSQKGFEKVTKMIDEMVQVLKREQQDDNQKKSYCEKEFDVTEDKKKGLERMVSDKETAIATTQDGVATAKDEIAALETGIAELDKSVAEATEQRKRENAEYKELMASDSAAKELLTFAKNRLNKFYNPKLYKPPPKAELSEEDRIYSNMGGELPTTTPGGIANTGVTVLAQLSARSRRAAPGPPPETWDAYAKKSEENSGVIQMIGLLINNIDKEMTEAETEEKDGQADYEQLMKDSAEKRKVDGKALAQKEGAKADLEAALEAHKTMKKDAASELMATLKYAQSLHAECDWLLQHFSVREEARAGEVDSLERAKAVLSGADYSFLQLETHTALRGSA